MEFIVHFVNNIKKAAQRLSHGVQFTHGPQCEKEKKKRRRSWAVKSLLRLSISFSLILILIKKGSHEENCSGES